MTPEVRLAHALTLREWAEQYERHGLSGDAEIAFLLRRAARLLHDDGSAMPEARVEEPPLSEPKDG